jgi:hypothetical protein
MEREEMFEMNTATREEIDITSRMIEAGVEELYSHDITEPKREEMREAVRAVFSAMCAVAHGTQSATRPLGE